MVASAGKQDGFGSGALKRVDFGVGDGVGDAMVAARPRTRSAFSSSEKNLAVSMRTVRRLSRMSERTPKVVRSVTWKTRWAAATGSDGASGVAPAVRHAQNGSGSRAAREKGFWE